MTDAQNSPTDDDGGELQRYWPDWLPNQPPVELWLLMGGFTGFGTLFTASQSSQIGLLWLSAFSIGFGISKWLNGTEEVSADV